MATETEQLDTDLNLAQKFQQIHVRKSPPKLGGKSMSGFKEFLLRGNVVDMAVGIVVGAAFGTVVTAFVKDLLTPFIAAVVKAPDFSAMSFTLHNSKFMIGHFINELISFILIASAVYFVVVIPVNKLIAMTQGPAAPTIKQCPECMSDIPINAKRCPHCTSVLS